MFDEARYPYSAGVAHLVMCNGFDENLPLSMPIIPQVLKRGGYQTHAVGKWDVRLDRLNDTFRHRVHGPASQIGYATWDMTPTYRGFDSFFGFYGCNEDCALAAT